MLDRINGLATNPKLRQCARQERAQIMTCIGKVSNGVVILPPGLDLADGTELEVRLPGSADRGIPFSERYKLFIGMAGDLPADLANNLDHYLHGLPKK